MERSGSNRGDRQPPTDDMDAIVTINDIPTTVNAIAVVIPCILSLCILVLIYTIFQFKSKGAQQNTTMQPYYKYPVQEWVWQGYQNPEADGVKLLSYLGWITVVLEKDRLNDSAVKTE